MKLKFAPFCSSLHALSKDMLFCEIKMFSLWPKTMDYSRVFEFLTAIIIPLWKVL